MRVGGVGGGETLSKLSTMKTQTLQQSTGGHEAQWTPPWSRVQSKVDTKMHSLKSGHHVLSLYNVRSYHVKLIISIFDILEQ